MSDGGQKVLQLRQRLEEASREATRLEALHEQAEERLATVRGQLKLLGLDPDADLEAQLATRVAEVEGQVAELEAAINSLKEEACRRSAWDCHSVG